MKALLQFKIEFLDVAGEFVAAEVYDALSRHDAHLRAQARIAYFEITRPVIKGYRIKQMVASSERN